EALLATSDERGEITYRLRLRAALMLAQGLEERQLVFENIGELYKLRSKVVHGSSSPTSNAADMQIVRWGLEACQSLLMMVIQAGHLPDLRKLVLSGNAQASFQ